MINPIWHEDTPVYIVGGGPSVSSFPIYRIKDRIIATNNAVDIVPHAEVHLACDRSWHDDYSEKSKQFGGLKFRFPTKVDGHDPTSVVLQRCNTAYLTLDKPQELAHCRHYGAANTGHSAIDLAVKLGSKKVRLIGYDMKVDENQNHNWHMSHRRKMPLKVYEKYKKSFDMMKESLDYHGVEVLNLGPDSDLDTFERTDYETLLS